MAALTPSENTVCTPFPCYNKNLCLLVQLENLVYFNRLKHSKIVISDFQLAKLENGLIKDPCGTPEYLGRSLENVGKKYDWSLQLQYSERGKPILFVFSSGGGCEAEIRQTCGLLGYWCHYVYTVSTISYVHNSLTFNGLLFHHGFILAVHQSVRKPSVLWRRRWGRLGQSWQEPLSEDSVRGLRVWLAILGWHFRFWCGFSTHLWLYYSCLGRYNSMIPTSCIYQLLCLKCIQEEFFICVFVREFSSSSRPLMQSFQEKVFFLSIYRSIYVCLFVQQPKTW